MTAADDTLRAETLEHAAHTLATEYRTDPYLQPGVMHAVNWLRKRARLHQAWANERGEK